MRCFGPPPGLDAPEWQEADPQLQGRLTLEVARLNRQLRELGGTHGELLWCSNELALAFALDQTGNGYGLPELAAFILISLDLIADQGDEAKRSVHEATQTVQNVIVLVCSRGLTIEELGHKGMPGVLRQRIATLFPGYCCTDDRLLGRLGVAKYRVFNDGVKFSRRRARTKNLVVSHAS